jgi:hypothetical protein
MALSEEATRRFTEYVERSDMSDTSFGHDVGLLNFVAWALVHDPAALRETFAFDRIISQRSGARENKRRAIHAVLAAAHPLIVAYERERTISDRAPSTSGSRTIGTVGPTSPCAVASLRTEDPLRPRGRTTPDPSARPPSGFHPASTTTKHAHDSIEERK